MFVVRKLQYGVFRSSACCGVGLKGLGCFGISGMLMSKAHSPIRLGLRPGWALSRIK